MYLFFLLHNVLYFTSKHIYLSLKNNIVQENLERREKSENNIYQMTSNKYCFIMTTKLFSLKYSKQLNYLKWFLCFNKLYSIIKYNFHNTQPFLEPMHDYILDQRNFVWGLNNLFQNLGFCFPLLILDKLIKRTSCMQLVHTTWQCNVDIAQDRTRAYSNHFCEIKISKFVLVNIIQKYFKNYMYVYPYISSYKF